MRIAVDGRPLRHPFTGIGVYTRELLSRIGTDHELFVYLDRAMEPPPEIRARFRAGPPGALARLPTVHLAFPRWARRDRVDVYWGPRHNLPLTLANIPAVVTIHDLVWRLAPETMRPLNRLLDAALMPIALARAARVVAVSADTAARIRRFSGRRDVDVVPLAPRGVTAAIPFAHPRPYFLFVGTKEPRKNLPGTVDGFRRAVAGGLTDHDLLLVGLDGWRRADLDALLAASDTGPRIIDLGPVSAARLAGIYRGCTALVLASFYEGFGIPLLEAMAYGKPVITSGAGAMAEVAGDAGLFVDPRDPRHIARAFLRLARDQGVYDRLAANASARSRLFSWDRAARQTIEVLAAAARRRG